MFRSAFRIILFLFLLQRVVMNNNNLQKRYFSPKRVFLYAVVLLLHILYAQACNDSSDEKNIKRPRARRLARSVELDRGAPMTEKKEYESSKNSNDDSFIDSVYAKNNANANEELQKSEYVDPFASFPEQFEDIQYEEVSTVGEDTIFRDEISERRGHNGQRNSEINNKRNFDKDQFLNTTFENDKEKESSLKDFLNKFLPGFETGHEDPFNRNINVFDEDRTYEIPGLLQNDAVMTKFRLLFYVLILSVFLL